MNFILPVVILSLLSASLLSACGSVEKAADLIGINPLTPAGEPFLKYSEQSNLPHITNRRYQRMTRATLEEESDLHAGVGSMWVPTGQSSYLFTQNNIRREGDILQVNLEGAAEEQIKSKVTVIKELLKRIEEESTRRPASLGGRAQAAAQSPTSSAGSTVPAPGAQGQEALPVKQVTTRVTDIMPDGNFRVRGQAPFMIGQREFRVIITGIVRPKDYDDNGISSNVLIEPQYDVVTYRQNRPGG
jgi:flagellar L-ring protein precursor FlgH